MIDALQKAIALIEEAAAELKRRHTIPPDYTDWSGDDHA